MPFKLPKIRLTLNPNTRRVNISKLTPRSIFSATLQDETKKAPPMPYVRNRGLKRVLKLLLGSEK